MVTVRGPGCVVCCGSRWHFQLDPTYVRTSEWLANSYGSVRSSIDSYHMSSMLIVYGWPTRVKHGLNSEGTRLKYTTETFIYADSFPWSPFIPFLIMKVEVLYIFHWHLNKYFSMIHPKLNHKMKISVTLIL